MLALQSWSKVYIHCQTQYIFMNKNCSIRHLDSFPLICNQKYQRFVHNIFFCDGMSGTQITLLVQ